MFERETLYKLQNVQIKKIISFQKVDCQTINYNSLETKKISDLTE